MAERQMIFVRQHTHDWMSLPDARKIHGHMLYFCTRCSDLAYDASEETAAPPTSSETPALAATRDTPTHGHSANHADSD